VEDPETPGKKARSRYRSARPKIVNERQELLKTKRPEGLPLDGRKPNMSGAAQQAPKLSDVHELMILLVPLSHLVSQFAAFDVVLESDVYRASYGAGG